MTKREVMMMFKKWWLTLNAAEKSAMTVLFTLAGLASLFNIGYFLGQWLYS